MNTRGRAALIAGARPLRWTYRGTAGVISGSSSALFGNTGSSGAVQISMRSSRGSSWPSMTTASSSMVVPMRLYSSPSRADKSPPAPSRSALSSAAAMRTASPVIRVWREPEVVPESGATSELAPMLRSFSRGRPVVSASI